MQQFLNHDEQLSCPFIPEALNCSSTGVNSVVEKKYLNSMRMHNFSQAFLNTRKRKDAEQKPAKKSTSTVITLNILMAVKWVGFTGNTFCPKKFSSHKYLVFHTFF